MMNEIAKIRIDPLSAATMSLSRKRLYETRKRPDGALNRILGWIKAENPRGFSQDGITLGGDDDDYAISYYADGMRYRVMRDGRCLVSSADWTNRCETEQSELQQVIETIIADDIVESMRNVVSGMPDAQMNIAKPIDKDGDGYYDSVMIGLQK